MVVVTKQRFVSKHFRDNAKLQKCLISPPDHVLPGSRGEHVGLIQLAIIKLGAGVIGASEITSQFYGESTKRAVLNYKGPPRNIITKAYQKVPDNIVGLVSVTEAGAPHDHTTCPRLEAGDHPGTPINPLGFKRKINIFGDHETDYLGFEDFSTDRDFTSRT